MSTYLNLPQSRLVFKYATDEAAGIVDAIVNTTGLVDRQKDIIHPGAFRKALNGRLPKVVNSHQQTEFLGKVLSMRELMPGDPELPIELQSQGLGALAVRMKFNLETQAGREMFSNVKGGYVDQWSFMFTIADAEYDGRGIRHIKMIDEIFEVSPVLVGANQATLTLAAKSNGSRRPTFGYCLGCKQSVAIKSPRTVEMNDKSSRTRGSCPRCGTKVYAAVTLTIPQLRRKIAMDNLAQDIADRAMFELWLEGKVDGPVGIPRGYKPPRTNLYQDGTRFDLGRDPRYGN